MTQPQDPYQPWPSGPQHASTPPGPPRSWPARHKALTAILGVVAFFAVFGIGAAAGGGKTGSSAGPAPTVTVTETEPGPTVTATAQAAAPSPSATPQQATAHTVATFSGSGRRAGSRKTPTTTS